MRRAPTARFTGMLGTAYPLGERRRARCNADRARPAGRRAPRRSRAPRGRSCSRSGGGTLRPRSGSTAASSPGGSISSPTRRAIRSSSRSEWRASAISCRTCGAIRWREHRRRRRALIFGISQSGRLIQTMLLRGLHVDEDGRPVFDGAFIHVAGGGKGGFDYRFAMPTRHFSVLEDHIYPTDFFPFATVTARDPVTGAEGSVLDRARALGVVPKLFYVNNSSEYWNRAASLIAHRSGGRARSAAGARGAHLPHRRRAALCRRSARARHLRQLRQHAQSLPRHARADGGVRPLGA